MSTPQSHNEPQTRPVSIPHLVFGVTFTGIAAMWAIGQATDADLPRSAIAVPVVLICAGIVGLVAILVNARPRRSTEPSDPYPPVEEATIALDDLTPITHEEQ